MEKARGLRALSVADQRKIFTFTVKDGKATIKGYKGTASDVTIPAMIGKATVSEIGKRAFYGRRDVTAIHLPDGIERIGDEAFYDCDGLTELTLPARVARIGKYAFKGCRGLTALEFPRCLTRIGEGAFLRCDGLRYLSIPKQLTVIGDRALSGCSSLERIEVEKGNRRYHAEGDCLIETQTKTLVQGCRNSIIPADGSVTVLGKGALCGCETLTELVLPDAITVIEDGALLECRGLTRVVLSERTTAIGHGVFSGCDCLHRLSIPASVTSMSEYTFSCCSSQLTLEVLEGTYAHQLAMTKGLRYEKRK